jgi:cytochrome c oxidase subunit 2
MFAPKSSARFRQKITNYGDSMKNKSMFKALLFAVLMTAVFSGPMAWSHDGPRRIEVTAKRFSFDPGEITLKKGEPVVLVVKSADVAHGVRFKELNVEVKVGAGGTAEVQFTPQKTGDFVGHCSVFCGAGHGTMILKLHVVD